MEKENTTAKALSEESEKNSPQKEASSQKVQVNQETASIVAIILSILALCAVRISLVVNALMLAFLFYKFYM